MSDQITPGDIRFIDNYIPLLDDDDYKITVTQTLTGTSDKGAKYNVNETFNQEQTFTVAGPRYRLPPDDIFKEFPPPGSQGIYERDLPHIVLTKRTLPWERNPFADNSIPWIALVLFDVNDILPPTVGSNASSQQSNPKGVTTIPISQLAGSQSGVLLPGIKPGPYDDPTSTCQVFDIVPETFKKAMPSKADLPFLTHCREVNMLHKASRDPGNNIKDESENDGTRWYSVIVGNRFPTPPKAGEPSEQNVVHLVSLEGFESYLDDPNSTTFPAGTERIRMISLASWTFTALPERGKSFRQLMFDIVAVDPTLTGAAKDNAVKQKVTFRVNLPPLNPTPTADESFAHRVVTAGYVPHSYQTRVGDSTFAWYRGPFTPELVAQFPADQAPFDTASEAAVYDQTYGLFDLSYAVAWENGRLLALADKSFGINLLNWRRQGQRLLDRLEALISNSTLSGILNTNAGVEQLHGLIEQNIINEKIGSAVFLNYLTEQFVHETQPTLFSAAPKPPINNESTNDPQPAASSIKTLADLFKDPGVQEMVQALVMEEVDPIVDWLAHLYLLYGVPFNNLVPAPELLPTESVRFFYVNRNWLDALLDGALSLGVQSSRDSMFQKLIGGVLRDVVKELVHDVRDKLLGITTPASGDAGEGPFAGMLLRSAAVSGWPGLEVKAYHQSDGTNPAEPMKLLRISHLSKDVLLCLFPEVPAWVEIDEPREGLHFGVEDANLIGMRHLSGPDTGKLFQAPEITVTAKPDSSRRLDIQTLLGQMKTAIKLPTDLSPADFAIQMVNVPEQMIFQNHAQ